MRGLAEHQSEATDGLEILVHNNREIYEGHLALGRAARSSEGTPEQATVRLANVLREYYEGLMERQFKFGKGFRHDVAHSLALNGLDLVNWRELAGYIFNWIDDLERS